MAGTDPEPKEEVRRAVGSGRLWRSPFFTASRSSWFTSDLLVLILRQSQQAPLLVVMDSHGMVLLYTLSVTLHKWGQAKSSGNTQCAAHEGQKSYRLSYE